MTPRAELCVLLALCCLGHVTPARDVTYTRGYRLNTTWQSDLGRKKTELYMESPDLLRQHGYPVESHVVTTSDGYVLTLHRIPHGRAGSGAGGRVRPPVLVMHGLFAASDLWILNGPDRGLGFILADAGYDVWLGNARGNYYSRKHVSIKPSDPKFWDFSWHEMGNLDLPAVIDYILDTTREKQIFYVGFSMGCTMFFSLMATQPQYNAKVIHMVGLAPVALNGRVRIAFGELFLPYARNIMEGFFSSGQLEIMPRITDNIQLAGSICADRLIGQALCQVTYLSVFGVDAKQLNKTMLPVFWSHIMAGTSAHTVNHYIENHKAGKFQWYDKTRQQRPMLEYNLTQVTVPVSLHYAMNDALLNPKAVIALSRRLPNVVQMYRLKEMQANHIDFALAIDSKNLVYNDVLHILKKYNRP